MELLYKTSIPLGRVHCISWSRMNLIALSVSVQTEGLVAKDYEGASTHQLLVFDPNRPWDFHTVASDYKSEVSHLVWSVEGTRLLALRKDGSVRVWRMKTNCINTWVCASKIETDTRSDGDVVHVAWLDYRPMVTIHHSKEDWTEVMEAQPFSPKLRMLLGTGFISVFSCGKVRVDSTSLPHIGDSGELRAEVQLPTRGRITIARTYVTRTGTILCGVGYENGQVKVFSLSSSLCWGNEFTLTATLATELHQMSSQSEEITDMLMLPLSDGCEVHLCYNKTQLYKWSVKDITRSGSYQSRREGSYSSTHSVSSLAGSGLCLGSHDLTVTENKMSELLVFGDEDMMKEGEQRWPTEVVVSGAVSGEVTIFSRESCKVLLTEKGQKEEGIEEEFPAAKRRRLDNADRDSCGCLVTISPNACCVAVARGNSVLLYQAGSIVMGLKDSSTPEVPRCSRLLSLSLVSGQSPWDLAIACSRLEARQGAGFVCNVLEHFSTDFDSNSSTLREQLLQQYYSACSLLQSSNEDGLLPALTYRRMSRLNATSTLLALSLPTQRDEESGLVESLRDVCLENSGEDKLEDIVNDLELRDFAIPTSVSSHLQGHCHWLVELAIKVVAAIAGRKGSSLDNVPDDSCLKLLRQCLVLFYIWNKVLPQPILPVTDGALSLLFKVITTYIQSPSTPFTEELQTEISTNIPIDKHPNLLSLSKAAHLQGFLSGLSAAELPESFIRGKSCRIRPSVQSKYTSLDPYSPLTLVVPQGLSPPWRDCFVEGQKDIVHGGGLTKAVVQNARLKQCSRCRSWTVASEGLQSDQTSLSPHTLTSHPVQQWRSAWNTTCLCGAPWTINTSKRT